MGALPSTQNTFSVLVDSVTALITNCDKSQIATAGIPELSQFVIKVLTLHIDSNNTKNVFCVLGRVPMFTFDMNMETHIFAHSGVISLRIYVLNRHNLQQSEIATSQEFLPSQIVFCRNLWPRLCRGKLSQITFKMCSVYLGEYPSSVLKGIWEVEYWPIFVLIAICIVYNSPNMRCRNEPPEYILLHWKGALDI